MWLDTFSKQQGSSGMPKIMGSDVVKVRAFNHLSVLLLMPVGLGVRRTFVVQNTNSLGFQFPPCFSFSTV
jgi:hypothetical protein